MHSGSQQISQLEQQINQPEKRRVQRSIRVSCVSYNLTRRCQANDLFCVQYTSIGLYRRHLLTTNSYCSTRTRTTETLISVRVHKGFLIFQRNPRERRSQRPLPFSNESSRYLEPTPNMLKT